MTPFAELVAATNFSFLRGASHAHEMVGAGGGAGARRHRHCRPQYAGRRGARASRRPRSTRSALLVGARLVTTDGFEAVCYPTDRAAYGRLCRLLTAGNRRAIKGQCHFSFEEMLAASEGQIFIALPPRQTRAEFAERLSALAAAARGRVYLGATLRLSRRRAPAPGRAGRAGRADARAAGRHQRCALSPPRPQAARRRAHLHPREVHDRARPAFAWRPMPSGT